MEQREIRIFLAVEECEMRWSYGIGFKSVEAHCGIITEYDMAGRNRWGM